MNKASRYCKCKVCFWGLVLGYVEADFLQIHTHFAAFFVSYNIYAPVVSLQTHANALSAAKWVATGLVVNDLQELGADHIGDVLHLRNWLALHAQAALLEVLNLAEDFRRFGTWLINIIGWFWSSNDTSMSAAKIDATSSAQMNPWSESEMELSRLKHPPC